jgi:hypothetical protein
MGNHCLYGKADAQHQHNGDESTDAARQVGLWQSFERLEKVVLRRSEMLALCVTRGGSFFCSNPNHHRQTGAFVYEREKNSQFFTSSKFVRRPTTGLRQLPQTRLKKFDATTQGLNASVVVHRQNILNRPI